jgi:hypothetical protein
LSNRTALALENAAGLWKSCTFLSGKGSGGLRAAILLESECWKNRSNSNWLYTVGVGKVQWKFRFNQMRHGKRKSHLSRFDERV